ncbi:MAG TPA: hypothetical protein VE978_25605 [Chitinophagales bacterium]|nr:hypothetical protein [Chitinophagales bacterium]
MKELEIYQAVWKKYLPVIAMKLKQVIRNNESSHVGMYQFEFHSTGKKKKVGYQFDLELNKGRVMNDISGSLVAKQLTETMKSDPTVRPLLNSGHFIFSLNSDYILTIQIKSEVPHPVTEA